jgi:acyl-CoA thioesterase-1
LSILNGYYIEKSKYTRHPEDITKSIQRLNTFLTKKDHINQQLKIYLSIFQTTECVMMHKKFQRVKRAIIKIFSTVLTASMVFQSFAISYSYLPPNARYPRIHDHKIRVMPFGDSITAGVSGSYSYRYFLWKLLQTAGYTDNIDFVGTMQGVYDGEEPKNPDFDQDHEGHPAWNTSNMLSSLSLWLASSAPDIVLMHMGTNDIGEGFTPANSKSNISAIIDTLRNHNPSVVTILARIVPSQVGTNSYPAFNDMISGLASEKNTPQSPVILIDMNSGFSVANGDYSDLVHLSSAGEQKMASRWYEAMVPVLNQMGVKPLEIHPGTGELLQTGHFDITVTLNAYRQKPLMKYEVTLDGILKKTTGLKGKVLQNDSVNAITFRMLDVIPRSDLGGPGRHVVTFALRFTDSTMVQDTVVWDVIGNVEGGR